MRRLCGTNPHFRIPRKFVILVMWVSEWQNCSVSRSSLVNNREGKNDLGFDLALCRPHIPYCAQVMDLKMLVLLPANFTGKFRHVGNHCLAILPDRQQWHRCLEPTILIARSAGHVQQQFPQAPFIVSVQPARSHRKHDSDVDPAAGISFRRHRVFHAKNPICPPRQRVACFDYKVHLEFTVVRTRAAS